MAYVLQLQALSTPKAQQAGCYSHVTSYKGTC
ncbi:hypothetical protein FHS43_006258 [Streptosporangium becharense]|uniref:Uncharacterized protein n=1 Tax=Streptosporangium becharense TaxID=1816182 RepID=A0A7W9MHA4_9ACTN|nr:hypothetical protein [Streptosporangium becharense]MBB5820243.1 hypothetical protein [Streptosporangium becharense]